MWEICNNGETEIWEVKPVLAFLDTEFLVTSSPGGNHDASWSAGVKI